MLFSFTLFTNYPSSFSSWNVSILSRNNESLLLRKKCINLYQLILGSYFSIAQFIKLSLQCSTTLENLKFDVWSRVGGFLGFFCFFSEKVSQMPTMQMLYTNFEGMCHWKFPKCGFFSVPMRNAKCLLVSLVTQSQH